ncbi:MAG TPA: hypothetical protein VGK63_10715 [Candidatus Limnocylindrales bacterium]
MNDRRSLDHVRADDGRDAPLENPAESRAEIRGRRADLDGELGPLGERHDPADPPRGNAPLGDSAGAGMGNESTDDPQPNRERFREMRS